MSSLYLGCTLCEVDAEGNVLLTDSMARAAIATVATTIIGRALTQFLVGWIPIAGNIINAGTAASITEALGWALAEDFARETTAA